jgi:hypothetical protein
MAAATCRLLTQTTRTQGSLAACRRAFSTWLTRCGASTRPVGPLTRHQTGAPGATRLPRQRLGSRGRKPQPARSIYTFGIIPAIEIAKGR